MTEPVRYAFGLHLHQPVGNFDSVFEQHLGAVYAPLMAALEEGSVWPASLHLSGPLLDWMEAHRPDFLDTVGRHVADGDIELLLAGYDEPILAILSRDDRLEQIGRMRDTLRRRFGADATGLWLTERVWEPGLAYDLAKAGVEYVLVDDRHFLATGFERPALHRPYRTEDGGASLAVFPIDERLRYLVPFRPPDELARYFEDLRAAGAPLAVLADDGEKFGGWPGTFEWVYERGWMRDYTSMLTRLRDAGTIELVTFRTALTRVASGGLAYLPSASYREMEAWSLPEPAASRLLRLERELGEGRLARGEGALIRGGHWRNFLVKYPESNRMHKKMLALSAESRSRGDPPAVRRAVGRAQCNDAYWHGVFGGLYLPHLRHAIWRELARAEELLRHGESLAWQVADLDADGNDEVWIHSDRFSAIVSPARGGAIEEWTAFASGRNLADCLTRRREAYHRAGTSHAAHHEGGTRSIHDIDDGLPGELPPFDDVDRAILQESVYAVEPDEDSLCRRTAPREQSWARSAARAVVERVSGDVEVLLSLGGLTKRLRFAPDGAVSVELSWRVDDGHPPGRWLVSELSLGWPAALDGDYERLWRYEIETMSKSERGYDRTRQGTAVNIGWPWERGRGTARVSAAAVESMA